MTPEDILPPDHLRAAFKFQIGGYFGLNHFVEWTDGQLRYGCAGFSETANTDWRILTPTPAKWRNFWKAVDQIGVWEWQPDYYSDVLDGTSWTLELDHGGRTLESSGSNGYPGSDGPNYTADSPFAQFLKAPRTLTGIRIE